MPGFPDLDLPSWTTTETGLLVPGAGLIDQRSMEHWLNTLQLWGDKSQEWGDATDATLTSYNTRITANERKAKGLVGELQAPGVAAPVVIPAAPGANFFITNNLTFFCEANRKYILELQWRALSPSVGTQTFPMNITIDGIVFGIGDQWVAAFTYYQGGNAHWRFNGDGATHSFRVICPAGASPAAAVNMYIDSNSTWFSAFDVGAA